MNLRDRLAKAFADLIDQSKASSDDVVALLEEIGSLAGGVVAPARSADRDEKYFVERARHALERQAVYYSNVVGGKRNEDFLSDSYVRGAIARGQEVNDHPGAASAYLRLRDRDSLALVATPTAATYMKRFLSKGVTLAPGAGKDVVMDELTAIRDRLRNHAADDLSPARWANTFMLEDFGAVRKTAAKQVKPFKAARRDRVAALYNDTYFEALLEALEKAKKRIAVLMFYFPYDRRRTRAVTTKLFKKLVAAHRRNVAISVVLDRDRPDQKYGTRNINANTIRALRKAGIDARFDSEDHVTHSKIITIDDELTFIGAHNWSSSASYLYEETSLLIRSTKVAKHYRAFIEAAT